MQTEIIISGFGGQGVLFAGQLLSYAALEKDLHVTWYPSYGPEMRGGTAHCTVIISDDEIGSPVIRNPTAVIVMNLPSLDKYEPLIKTNGVLIVNTSLVDRDPEREDLRIVLVPANDIAEELGDKRMSNLVMLGSLVNKLDILSIEDIGTSLDRHIPKHRRNLLEGNLKALERGAALAMGEKLAT
ncbi:MAG: 2-oxoacid:acceptor oxidoreductase family protein [Anaerolineaceae bacterium]|nr:MAG: 2-oxoacid:acceptor oxidoreductase family protein [Anaerolineaceae bacterium]